MDLGLFRFFFKKPMHGLLMDTQEHVGEQLISAMAPKTHPSVLIARLVLELLISSEWFPCAWNCKCALFEILQCLICSLSDS